MIPDEPRQQLANRLSDDINSRYGDRPWILAGIALGLVFLGSLLSGLCGDDEGK